MVGRDTNLVPVDASGDLIPLPLSPTSPLPVSFISSVPAKFHGGFVQADYLVLPWVMVIGRWDGVHSSADRINGLALTTGTPFFGPLNSTRNRFTPGLQFLIHPNVKVAFEYQFRPRQITQVAGEGITTALRGLYPFRVNTFLAGLEFVY
jgi:hypothetical protein